MTPDQLFKHFGASTAKAAQALGVTPQTVRDWMKAKRIPFRAQESIQLRTNGALKASK